MIPNFKPFVSHTFLDGQRQLYKFPNSFGASVMHNLYPEKRFEDRPYEVAILNFDGTGIDNSDYANVGIVGNLSAAELENTLTKIKELPANLLPANALTFVK